jgi:hypothetical protein
MGGHVPLYPMGVTNYCMDPSYVPSDPLFEVIHAMVELLRYGGEARCNWHYEPEVARWILSREGDTLHIAIHSVRDGFFRLDGPINLNGSLFSTTCDLWKFAAAARLAASRLQPAGEQYHHPSSVQRTPEYRALRPLLEARKHDVPRSLST